MVGNLLVDYNRVKYILVYTGIYSYQYILSNIPVQVLVLARMFCAL
jgi:hypothetical protein